MFRATGRVGMTLAILLIGASGAIADSKPKLSDPKSAAKAFAAGMQKADMSLVRAASIGSDADYQIFQALAGMASASAKLRDAATQKFGAQEAGKLSQAGPANLDEAVDKSTLKIEGDNAFLNEPGHDAAAALRLKKVGGDWKVDLTQMPDKEQMAQLAPTMKELQKVVEQTTDEVKAGKYRSISEVEQAVRTRMVAVSQSMRPPAASQPAPSANR